MLFKKKLTDLWFITPCFPLFKTFDPWSYHVTHILSCEFINKLNYIKSILVINLCKNNNYKWKEESIILFFFKIWCCFNKYLKKYVKKICRYWGYPWQWDVKDCYFSWSHISLNGFIRQIKVKRSMIFC